MPIQFRCPQCNKLLQTRDDAAGKQAKCPDCGALVTVPGPGEEAPAGAGPPGAGEGASPFGGPPPVPGELNPYASPTTQSMPGPMPAPPGEIRATQIDLGDVFSRAWEIFKPQWGMCLGVVLLVWIISFAVSMILGLIPIVGPIAGNLFGMWLGIGQALFFLKTARGQPAQVGDIFTGGPYFLSVLGGSILLGLMILGIGLGCFLPPLLLGLAISEEAAVVLGLLGGVVALALCVYVGLVFSQFYYLILDRNPGAVQALGLSRQITRGNRLTLFGIGLLCMLINLGGLLVCCVGVFVTTSYIMLLAPVIYLAMTGQPTAGLGYSAYTETAPGSPFQQ